MGEMDLKTFLAYARERDKSLLSLITNFRVDERDGKVVFITEDPRLKKQLLRIVASKLGREILSSIEVVVEEKESKEKKTSLSEGLNPRYSFVNFVVGEGNRLAYEVAREVAENPGGLYNPLFIYGSVGLGKTHLLQAIGNSCAQKGLKVVYKSATDFSEEMVEAFKGGGIKEFRDKYKKVDVLLLDDVQLLSGKTRTQEELFNIFNHLFLRDRQIVFASDRHPKELRDISDRLVSRFEGGVVVEVSLDEITKLEIVKRKLQELRIEVQERIVQLVMESTGDNVREIEGFVRTIKLKGADAVEKKTQEGSDLEKIKSITASYFRVKAQDLCGNTRSRKLNRIRHIAMYLCRKLTDASLIEIARAFGRRDHSTVIHGIRKIEEERKRDRRLNNLLTFLERQIGDRL